MALRPALIAIGAATIASFAAGWWTGLAAKSHPETRPAALLAPPPSLRPAQPVSALTASATAPDDPTFKQKILPFLQKYCVDCHNADKASGGLTLDGYQTETQARKNRKDWAAVQHVLAAGEMPPKKKTQPAKDEKEFVVTWIETALTKTDCTGPKDPGRVTIRRLNRAEYNNTIRDLCGVDFKPAEDFPADDVGYGFDNIGDVLSFQPILLEKYLAAADKILDKALTLPTLTATSKQKFPAQNLSVFPRNAKPADSKEIVFGSDGNASPADKFNFPEHGEYSFRFRGWGKKAGGEFPKVVLRIDGRDVKTFTVDAPKDKQETYEVRERLPAGEKKVLVAFVNPFEDKKQEAIRQFGLSFIEIEGPFNAVPRPDPESVKLLLVARPAGKADHRAAAEKVLSTFARRAYRRPLKPAESQRLMKLYDVAAAQDEPFEKAVRLPMKAVLVSPHFLYRIEDDPPDPNGVRTLNDFEFATRLSYFLWSSMPDEELYRLAEQGTLRDPGVLGAQVRRMLKDPKVRALSENFAGQWLQLRNVKTLTPDKGFFPAWDDALRAGMVGEAEAFFEYVVQNDRSALEFLDADYAFVNERMAKHYGIPNVTGEQFRKIRLPDTRRGGVITMASTLTVTSNPTRTSPVKRGKWILENVLGTPPPPPAPDVPELPPTGQLKGTLRQQMEQHRANPSCATCHAKLDPLGFGLENFDAIGSWRTADNKQPVDSSGVLPDGAKFKGPAEMRKVLLGKADLFRRCFAEKLLTFALGRGLEYYDTCAVDEIVSAAKTDQDRFSALVLAVVRSDPFQKRKGKRSE
ncbi:MAG: hypothetical protein JWO38_6077 [Gemmataceae bacterium]|nr:hypothetical protein [Gemmataceae bacterium]